MRIHLVVNMSQVVKYRELVNEQKVNKPELVEINKEEKQEIKKILNKQKK